jgi:hypothetical protein
MMKTRETKKPLPKLEIRTLDHQELSKVTGGLPPQDGCTNISTHCICCEDGLIDNDTNWP